MNSKSVARDKIFIVAGEISGDSHGADLVKAILSRRPDLSFMGIGGERMAEAGVELIWPSHKISVVGIVEILEKVPSLIKAFLRARKTIRCLPLSTAIFIDFPDFNLRLAKVCKKKGVPVIYYISPQIWAWRKWRVHTISRLVDRMLVILPFEEAFYKEYGVEVEYVGHPLADKMKSVTVREASSSQWKPDQPVIGLMPGSRSRELLSMLPSLLNAAKIIKNDIPAARFVLLVTGDAGEKTARGIIEEAGLDVRIEKGPNYQVMARFDYVIVATGTATLEAAMLNIPMVIIYRAHPLSWRIFKILVKLPNLGLPNLLAGKRIVPELWQNDATPERMAQEALKALKDSEKYLQIKNELAKVAVMVGEGGAAQRAAEAVLSRL